MSPLQTALGQVSHSDCIQQENVVMPIRFTCLSSLLLLPHPGCFHCAMRRDCSRLSSWCRWSFLFSGSQIEMFTFAFLIPLNLLLSRCFSGGPVLPAPSPEPVHTHRGQCRESCSCRVPRSSLPLHWASELSRKPRQASACDGKNNLVSLGKDGEECLTRWQGMWVLESRCLIPSACAWRDRVNCDKRGRFWLKMFCLPQSQRFPCILTVVRWLCWDDRYWNVAVSLLSEATSFLRVSLWVFIFSWLFFPLNMN